LSGTAVPSVDDSSTRSPAGTAAAVVAEIDEPDVALAVPEVCTVTALPITASSEENVVQSASDPPGMEPMLNEVMPPGLSG